MSTVNFANMFKETWEDLIASKVQSGEVYYLNHTRGIKNIDFTMYVTFKADYEKEPATIHNYKVHPVKPNMQVLIKSKVDEQNFQKVLKAANTLTGIFHKIEVRKAI